MTELQNKINDLYKNFGYLSKSDFINFAIQELSSKYLKPDISKTAKELVESKPDYQIAVKKRVNIKYEIEKLPGSYQIDIIFFNNTNLPFLFIIDVVSRKVWIFYVKSKKEETVFPVFEDWFYQGLAHKEENTRFVGSVLSDQESSIIYGKKFLDLFNKYNIRFIMKDTTEHNIMKILDSAVRTIKNMFYRYINTFSEDEFDKLNNLKGLIKIVDTVVLYYNSKPHSSLNRYTPNEVYLDFDLQDKFYKESKKRNRLKRLKDINLNKNDYVRVRERRNNKLDKSRYFSDKVYVIDKKTPYSYSVKNIDGSIPNEYNPKNLGSFKFKPYELRKITNPVKTNGRFRLSKIKSIHSNSSENNSNNNDDDENYVINNNAKKSIFGRVYKPNPKYL